MRHWLIRKKDFSFLRPVSETDLIQMIEGGELNIEDEVCPSLGYWFSLHEAGEIRKHLGEVKLNALYLKEREENTMETATDRVVKTKIITPTPLAHYTELPARTPESPLILKIVIYALAGFSAFILMVITLWLRTY